MTERPIEDRSDIIKELYSDLSIVKPQQGCFSYVLYSNHHTCVNNRKLFCIFLFGISSLSGSSLTFGNIAYVFLFGWWISLFYFLICPVMYLTIFGAPYGMYLTK